MSVRKQKVALLLIMLLALLTRTVLLTKALRVDSRALTTDSPTYLTAAKSLIATGSLRDDEGRPEINRTPGYPLFLLACGLNGPPGMVLLRSFRCSSTCFWYFSRIDSRLNSLVRPQPFMSDDLFAVIITLTIMTSVCYFREKTWCLLAVSAVLTAIATYVRPVGLMFAAVVTLALLLRANRLRNIASYLLLFASLVGPWFVRNHIVADYNGFSSISDKNMLRYESASSCKLPLDREMPFVWKHKWDARSFTLIH
jgi:hypothetical protein